MRRVTIKLRIHRNRRDPQLLARADDAHRDLATIRNQDLCEHAAADFRPSAVTRAGERVRRTAPKMSPRDDASGGASGPIAPLEPGGDQSQLPAALEGPLHALHIPRLAAAVSCAIAGRSTRALASGTHAVARTARCPTGTAYWYLKTAAQWYFHHVLAARRAVQTLGFMPLYPMLMWVVAHVTPDRKPRRRARDLAGQRRHRDGADRPARRGVVGRAGRPPSDHVLVLLPRHGRVLDGLHARA